jgi:uncharacterized protein (DUF1501 family)
MNRRTFIKSSLAGLMATWAFSPRLLLAGAPRARAKACILLWMNGGPSHVDTWDPKPTSRFKAIATGATGIQVAEHLPQLAAQANKLAILRGLSSKEGNHDRAQHLLHTGYAPNPTVAYPSLGSWIIEELGDSAHNLPGFVSINGPSVGPGFLGVEHAPFVVFNPAQPPQNTAHARNVDMVRFLKRRGALDALEAQFAHETGDAKVKSRGEVYAKAVRMMYSERLKAFDLADEPAAVQSKYGDHNFGRGCLMARRLVEAGVKFVEVVLDGWDTHTDNFGRTKTLMGVLDPAMATLIAELDERKLLDSTLIVTVGEFGRTPRINEREGRDHHPQAFSAVLAGAGVRGGIAHGETDSDGAKVVKDQTSVPDFIATVASLLGVSPQKEVRTPRGRPITVTDGGRPITQILESA